MEVSIQAVSPEFNSSADMPIENEAIDHFLTQGDKAFTNGWGKMYLIR